MKTVRLTVVLVLLLTLTVLPGSARGQIVLNELMPDPASDWSPTDGDEVYDSLDDEWVEVLNAGSEAVDITGWRLRDAVSDSSWRFGFSGVLGPGDFFVVFGNEAYEWEDANGYSKNGLSMNNTGDTITLVSADLTTVVDLVTYEGGDIGDDRAWGRVPDGSPNWECIDGLNPATPPGSGTPPTPGGPNVGAPVETIAWACIKALYR